MSKMSALKFLFAIGIATLFAGISLFVLFWERLDSNVEQNNLGETHAILSAVGVTIDEWIRIHGAAPATSEGIAIVGLRKKDPLDAWGRRLIYKRVEGPRKYLLYSVGPDGIDSDGKHDDVIYQQSK